MISKYGNIEFLLVKACHYASFPATSNKFAGVKMAVGHQLKTDQLCKVVACLV